MRTYFRLIWQEIGKVPFLDSFGRKLRNNNQKHSITVLGLTRCSGTDHGRRKRGCRGCSCTPIQKLGGANMSFCTPKNLEGPFTVVVREIANFP